MVTNVTLNGRVLVTWNLNYQKAQKTTGPKSVETVWNYIATSVHL